MTRTEYASVGRGGIGAYEGLSQRTGRSLADIVELAAQDRLIELRDEWGFFGKPLTPTEALRRLDSMKYAPGEAPPPLSPHQVLGELRAMRTIWRAEEREALRRPLNPLDCLAEIRARQIPSWWWGLV